MGTDCSVIIKKKDGTLIKESSDRYYVFSNAIEQYKWYNIEQFRRYWRYDVPLL